jgi:hypothetical protein
MERTLRGLRYCTDKPLNIHLQKFAVDRLPYLDLEDTLEFYSKIDDNWPKADIALLGCNDRFFLLTVLLGRKDANHPWLFDRVREVEQDPDGHLDLWSRFHYKSTIITFAGAIQEIVCNPEIKIAIFSVVKPIAKEFLSQIKEEFESNDRLKEIYDDVLWENPREKGDGKKPPKWGIERGIVVKRTSNPKEATLEAHGLIDGQPTSRHFDLHIYDDVVTQDYISEDLIKKTTERWEMADNLGSHLGIRKWVCGTRYHFADTYSIILERKSLKPRIYPATDDGTMHGEPVFLSKERWEQIKRDQRSTVSAQCLLNPIAGTEATFNSKYFKFYDVFPSMLNVYILCDPSKGSTQRSDRTAIAVIGIDVGGNKYLLDGYRHRMKLSERYQCMVNMYDKWSRHPGVQNVQVGYEIYGQQADLEVILEYQIRDNRYFKLEELNTPRQGGHSKDDRIERLEPDIRHGIFYLPEVVYHPDVGGRDKCALWQPWTSQDDKEAKRIAAKTGKSPPPHQVGQIVFRPMLGATKRQRICEARMEGHRVVKPIKRKDENGDVYDLTRVFMDEAMRHPFAPHDDLIDAVSRIYDMNSHKPTQHESASTASLEDTLENEDLQETSYG